MEHFRTWLLRLYQKRGIWLVQKVIHSTHIYVLLIMSTGFMVHVLLHPVILTVSKRDSWLSVIGSVVPFIVWTVLIYYLNKKFEQKNMLSFLFSMHPLISYSLRFLISFYFILTAFITFKYTAVWAETNYTTNIPDFFVVIPFAILCLQVEVFCLSEFDSRHFVHAPYKLESPYHLAPLDICALF